MRRCDATTTPEEYGIGTYLFIFGAVRGFYYLGTSFEAGTEQ